MAALETITVLEEALVKTVKATKGQQPSTSKPVSCGQEQGQRPNRPRKRGKKAGHKSGGKADPKSKPNFLRGTGKTGDRP